LAVSISGIRGKIEGEITEEVLLSNGNARLEITGSIISYLVKIREV